MACFETPFPERTRAAEVAAETAAFQRDVAWARLRGGGECPAALGAVPPVNSTAFRAEGVGTVNEAGPDNNLRIALVATPRTGNTWIRTLLAEAFGLEQIAVHTPTGIPWVCLPARLVVQLHWHRLPAFRAALREAGFHIVTIARNPLDVLVSVLQFRQTEPATESWLSGEGGDESSLVGAGPGDPAFLSWALSPRARALLSITAEWWSDPDVVRVRYEDFVANAGASLVGVARLLRAESTRNLRAIGEEVSLEEMRKRFVATPGHFWKGRPGIGLEVLDARSAAAVVSAHESVYRALDYSRHVPERSTEEARRAWIRHAGA